MKQTLRITIVISVFALVASSCGAADTPAPIPTIALDRTDTTAFNQVQASALVVPAREARLSFVISGTVASITVNEGDQVQAGQALAVLDTTELEYDIVAAQAALTAAEMNAQTRRRRKRTFDSDARRFVYVSPPAEKIEEADSLVEQTHAALEAAKATLEQATLIAPFEGTVVDVEISPGEYVQPAQVVIVIADLQDARIETTDLSELNISTIELGQPARVFVEALNEEFPGEVTAISPISNNIGGDVVYKVTVQLNKHPEDLLWGMSADVEIEIK